MEINGELKEQLIFRIEFGEKREKIMKTRKSLKLSVENLVKIAEDKLNGKMGEC